MGLGEYPAATIRFDADCKLGLTREICRRGGLWRDLEVRLRPVESIRPVEVIIEAAMKVRPQL